MTTIYWAGDSTVKCNSVLTYPQTGIGQTFERYVRRLDVRVENHAENGRSAKSFLEEGRLEPIRERRRYWEQRLPEVYEILREGSRTAREKASQTLQDVRHAMRIDNIFANARAGGRVLACRQPPRGIRPQVMKRDSPFSSVVPS